jgi:hypothetical protein
MSMMNQANARNGRDNRCGEEEATGRARDRDKSRKSSQVTGAATEIQDPWKRNCTEEEEH